MYICLAARFDDLSSFLSSKNTILTIRRFLELKNFHHNLYFNTIKVILSYFQILVMIFLYFILLNPNYRTKERILSARYYVIHWPIDRIRICSSRTSNITQEYMVLRNKFTYTLREKSKGFHDSQE